MSGILQPSAIYGPTQLDSDTQSSLAGNAAQTSICGGISQDGKKAWIIRGPILEVVKLPSGRRLAAHRFDKTTGEEFIQITSVREYPYTATCMLCVGLKTEGDRGLLCIFNACTSKVVKAINLPHGITCIEPVTTAGGIAAPNFALCDQLQRFFGIIAVGTEKGHIYLLDMMLDADVSSDEAAVREAKVVTLKTGQFNELRIVASRKGEHLCMEINDEAHSYFGFKYMRPDNSCIRDFSPEEVFVSGLTYFQQTGTLAVGFNFGCFQLWQLKAPQLEYSSPISPQVSPVIHFSCQEPCDDPDNFCYMWIGRGPPAWEDSQDVPTDIHLFQLSYDSKEKHGAYGYLYKDLATCIPRFRHYLTHDPHISDEDLSVGSRLIGCYTLSKKVSQNALRQDDSIHDEDDSGVDSTLHVLVWEGRPETADGQLESLYYLSIFDLNRWYYAQMPTTVRMSAEDKSRCSYFSFCSLESIQQAATPDFLLYFHIDTAKMLRFQSTFPSVPEVHLQPSALSFGITCLMETSLVRAEFKGVQKQILCDLSSQGPTALADPSSMYTRCWKAYLISRGLVSDHPQGRVSPERQREGLLTVALENSLESFLLQCIRSWTQGDFSSRMDRRTLMEWAWEKVAEIKRNIDEMCIPLYDGYGTFVDDKTHRQLNHFSDQLNHLVVVFKELLDQFETTTEQGVKDLSTKFMVLSLISEHIQVVLWFIQCGLLPECTDDMGVPRQGQFAFPASVLRQAYKQRRAQFHKLSGSDHDMLIIDGIISEAGPSLSALWQRKEEGGEGMYPPPSIHALLEIFLLQDIPLVTKHCIVGYVLLDIISTLSSIGNDELVEEIGRFYTAFSLSPGMTKLIQAFWLLDHRDFAEALNLLLDPMTERNLSPWQHDAIIRSFLYHGEGQKALQYVRTVHPPLKTPDDIKLDLTVLLANGLTAEAFHFQQDYYDEETSEELLYHLFLGSQQTKTMDQLLKLPFREREDEILRKYLMESTEPNSQELLVIHHLQRAQFVDAIRLNEKMKLQSVMAETDPVVQERTFARNALLGKCQELMPEVQRKLIFNLQAKSSRPRGLRKEVPRPQPLSTKINPAKTNQVLSHALLMTAVMEQIEEARECMAEERTPSPKTQSPRIASTNLEPFIGTPITPRTKSKKRFAQSFIYPETSEQDTSIWNPSTAPAHLLSQISRIRATMTSPHRQQPEMKRPHHLDYTGNEALSLLQTPPVKRRTPLIGAGSAPAPPTPQSILKVRNVVRRSPSPTKCVSPEPPLPPPFPSFSTVEFAFPTPPPLKKNILSFAEPEESVAETTATPVKHIRFQEDTKSASPSPLQVQIRMPSPQKGDLEEMERAPSPEWGTPPSGSPVIDEEVFEEPQAVMEEGHKQESPLSIISQVSQKQLFDDEDEMQKFEHTEELEVKIIQQEQMNPLKEVETPVGQVDMEMFEEVEMPASGDGVRGVAEDLEEEVQEVMKEEREENAEEDEEVTFNFGVRHDRSEVEHEGEIDQDVLGIDEKMELDEENMEMGNEHFRENKEHVLEEQEGESEILIIDGEDEEANQDQVSEPASLIEPFRLPHGDMPPLDYDLHPRPPIHPIPVTIANWISPPKDQATAMSSPDKSTYILDVHPFPTPPQRNQSDDIMSVPSQDFAAPMQLAKLTQESVEIQTSPFQEFAYQKQAEIERTEISVQTSPGLVLRPEGQRSMLKTPLRMSLRSHGSQSPSPMLQPQPAEVIETAEEPLPVIPEETTSLPAAPPVVDEEVVPIPRPAIESISSDEEAEKFTKEELLKQQFTTPPRQSFIFSPPSTRSRSKRKVQIVTTKGVLPDVPPPQSIGLFAAEKIDAKPEETEKSVTPISKQRTKLAIRRSSRKSLTPASPAPITRDSMKRHSSTPSLPVTPSGPETRGRRSRTPVEPPPLVENDFEVQFVQSDAFSNLEGTRDDSVIRTGSKEMKITTRARRATMLPTSNSPINLISPVPELEGETETKKKRVVRIQRHTMSLRTTRQRKSMKLF